MPGDPRIETSEGSYRLYVRSYAAGQTISLGGNGAGNKRMYLPVVVDASGP